MAVKDATVSLYTPATLVSALEAAKDVKAVREHHDFQATVLFSVGGRDIVGRDDGSFMFLEHSRGIERTLSSLSAVPI